MKLFEKVIGHVGRVDRERGIIHNCRVLGWKSLNGRTYRPEGVNPELYEGKRVNLGHVKVGTDRSPLDTYGWLEGISRKAAGMYAERLCLLNPKGEFQQRLLDAAERAPHLFCLSHCAEGEARTGSNGTIIESVSRVESVDIVLNGATTSSLFEDRTMRRRRKWCVVRIREGSGAAMDFGTPEGGIDPNYTLPSGGKGSGDAPSHGGDLMGAILDLLDGAGDTDGQIHSSDYASDVQAIRKIVSKYASADDETPDEPARSEESRRGFAPRPGQVLLQELRTRSSVLRSDEERRSAVARLRRGGC